MDVEFYDNRNKFYRAEIKICHGIGTTRAIREALGQLFEYNYYGLRKPADEWGIVINEKPSERDIQFIKCLNTKLNFPLHLWWFEEDEFKFLQI